MHAGCRPHEIQAGQQRADRPAWKPRPLADTRLQLLDVGLLPGLQRGLLGRQPPQGGLLLRRVRPVLRILLRPGI